MAEPHSVPPISDASVPSAGRIYDYLLGGNHNFEIDRIAAGTLLKDVPGMRLGVRLVRWFLGAAVRRLVDEGFTMFIDFASGLPTVDHIHEIAPSGTKVIYSDIDMVTVAYGQKIVEGLPDVAFVHGDAGSPGSILRMPIVEHLFGTSRRVAIGFNGIAWFLSDDRVRNALMVLYDWADKGSRLFLCDTSTGKETAQIRKVEDFYDQVKEPVRIRTEDQFRSLLGKWKICQPGVKSVESWLSINSEVVERTKMEMGGNLVAAILEKV